MTYTDGDVTIPVARYDFLKGLELLLNKEIALVMDGRYDIRYFTTDEAIRILDTRLNLTESYLEDHRSEKKKLANMNWAEFKQWKAKNK